MDKKEITLSPELLEGVVASAVTAALGATASQNKRSEFDGTMTSRTDTDRALRSVKFNKKLVEEKDMIRVSIPLVYREYVGSNVTVSVNGNTIKVPVDNRAYMISKAHNHQLQKKLNGVNNIIARNSRLAPANMGGSGDWDKVMV